MSNMEEKLWEYIDGTCNEQDRITIAALIERDENWRITYNNLLQMEGEILSVRLEEPPMAFTYNVIESIRKEQAAKPLKIKVNSYVITGIAGVLLLTLGFLLVMVMDGVMQSSGNRSLDINIQLIDLSDLTSSAAMKAFVYVDIMLLLFLVNEIIRNLKDNPGGSKSV